MPEFLKLLSPQPALHTFLQHIALRLPAETLKCQDALGRVTAEPILAPHPLPTFSRSAVDGYAVLAADTFGASESLPSYLAVIGESPMGAAPTFALARGQAAIIHTGGMLPEGCNAVVMLEHTQTINAQEIEVLRPAAIGENVISLGEDVKTGEIVIPAGRLLRPAELGGLAALGILEVVVARQPRVALLPTGDEVVPPNCPIQPGQVRDVHTSTLGALVSMGGGIPVPFQIIPDNFTALQAAAETALAKCDMVVITAGSSASTRDLTSEVIQALGAPGVLVHGVNVRPGKPTILAVCQGKPVIGLPGNPVSALVVARLFMLPAVSYLLGAAASPQPTVKARLTLNIPSQAGREDWTPVIITSTADEFQADPVFGKSNLIFTLARAYGLVRIPPDVTGLDSGSLVEVWPL